MLRKKSKYSLKKMYDFPSEQSQFVVCAKQQLKDKVLLCY